MAAFLDMGGYAAFVWPAWILSAVVVASIAMTSVRRLKSLERELAEVENGRGERP
ncbi:MAG: heme exporter protein CcmD [Alphaproteobacteria bacterium]|nr:heme exporter protein CcmD [Alphaproteobacteria bacterium]